MRVMVTSATINEVSWDTHEMLSVESYRCVRWGLDHERRSGSCLSAGGLQIHGHLRCHPPSEEQHRTLGFRPMLAVQMNFVQSFEDSREQRLIRSMRIAASALTEIVSLAA